MKSNVGGREGNIFLEGFYSTSARINESKLLSVWAETILFYGIEAVQYGKQDLSSAGTGLDSRRAGLLENAQQAQTLFRKEKLQNLIGGKLIKLSDTGKFLNRKAATPPLNIRNKLGGRIAQKIGDITLCETRLFPKLLPLVAIDSIVHTVAFALHSALPSITPGRALPEEFGQPTPTRPWLPVRVRQVERCRDHEAP